MNAKEIATKAADIVSGDRQATHGDMMANFNAIAEMWTALLKAAGKDPGSDLDAHDVANMMEALKIARRYSGAFNVDDYVDGCGYAACAGDIRARMSR
jgi:hypothetical protein